MIIITKRGINLIGPILSKIIAILTRIEEMGIGVITTISIKIIEAISIKRKRTYLTLRIKNMKRTITQALIIISSPQAPLIQT